MVTRTAKAVPVLRPAVSPVHSYGLGPERNEEQEEGRELE
jgi:hypothetical protein